MDSERSVEIEVLRQRTDEQVLNFEMVQELQTLDRAQPEKVFREIIEVYFTSADERIEKMQLALGALDEKRIRIEAHSLRASSANVGSRLLPLYCAQLETWSESDEPWLDKEQASELIKRIVSESFDVNRRLAGLLT